MITHIITGVLIEQASPLNLEEISQAVHLQPDRIIEMVEYHLLEPLGSSPEQWQFDDVCLKRARIAASFYRDLEVNLSGIALALDLLDQIEQLEKQLQILKRLEEL